MLSPENGRALQAEALAKSRIYWDQLYKQQKERPRTQAPPVLYVLNTTFRGTHTFGNQEFGLADIISTPKAKTRLETDGRLMREELRDQWKVPGLETHATTAATLTVEGTLSLDTPEVKIQFISVGDCVGEGDAVVFLPGQKVLFAGDVVIPGFMPYFKGRTLTVRHWIETLKALEKLDIESVVPGHGELAKKDGIKQEREFLEALVSAVQEAIKAGKTMEDAAKTVKLPDYVKWTRYDEWLGENVKLVYRELKEKPPAAEEKSGGPGLGVAEPGLLEKGDPYRDK
jgi:cyclase